METTTTTDNAGNGNRIDQFKTEVTDLNLKTGNVGREKLLAVLGVLLMIVGIGGAFLGVRLVAEHGQRARRPVADRRTASPS